jgi:pimeloyl-ACP methyl ester carboxylesterase
MPLLLGGAPPTTIRMKDLATIRVPTTVAFGEQSRPLFQIASRSVAKSIPDAVLVTVRGGDHMLPERDPDRFAALLLEWLGRGGAAATWSPASQAT